HLRTAEYDFADFARLHVAVLVVDDTQLDAERCATARIEKRAVTPHAFKVIVLVKICGNRRYFRHAVALDQHIAEYLVETLNALGRHGRGPVADRHDAAGIRVPQARVFEHPEQHGGHQMRMRDALLLYQFQPALGAEVALVRKHDRRSDQPRRHIEHVYGG